MNNTSIDNSTASMLRMRILILAIIGVALAWLGYSALSVKPEASFNDMIPADHPYIENYKHYQKDLADLGNVVRIVVQSKHGDIFDEHFQEILKQVTDEVFYIPGVNRDGLKSIWTPNVRWQEVTEEGFVGGTVIPDGFDASPAMLDKLRTNILKSGQVGVLVANDMKSAIVVAPLQEVNPDTGKALDYHALSSQLENKIRDKYEDDNITIRILGFAKVVGSLIDGAVSVVGFFALAVVITFVMLLVYSRCIRSTITVLCFSVFAVIAQLGVLSKLGFGINPYSMLVPFLVFAIGVSHGVQIINAMIHARHLGHNNHQAAVVAFSSLFAAGITALISDAIGFTTLMVIDIGVIQELAIAASIGVAIVIFTNLIAIPLVMSYVGISKRAVEHSRKAELNPPILPKLFTRFSEARAAKQAIVVALVLLAVGLYGSGFMKIGDLDPGAPELRPDSRYNQDNAYVVDNYSSSTDVFVVMAETENQQCVAYDNLTWIDTFSWHMRDVKGVQEVKSVVDVSKLGIFGMNEGSIKWYGLNRNQLMTNASVAKAPQGLINQTCSMVPVLIYLDDHKATTLKRVAAQVEQFTKDHPSESLTLLMAAGNAGIEAATNQVIETAQLKMLIWVYSVVIVLCFITFRSLRIVLAIILPLMLTSILSQALMAGLGIGVKVATLPVIALGVGIGVDYGIYIFSKIREALKQGKSLAQAYNFALCHTGKAVAFTGFTLAIGVATWVFSPIKFQADMGLLLTFMFIWNMIGALVLTPALAWLFGLGKTVKSGE